MKIIPGKMAENQRETTTLAFREAGVQDMDADIIDMFTSLANDNKVSSEADKAIGTAIRNRYGSKATWRAERWFVPVPKLHYEGKDVPQLVIEVGMYLVAAAAVRTQQDSRLVTLVGAVGKPETLAIPMTFLHALIESDLGRFAIVARDSIYTTWEVPGTKPVRIPNEFTVDEIKDASRTARIHSPGFSEDMFESLMELERRIADSGYLEVIQGLLRLEEEKGISCTEALDACEELAKRKTELERRVPELEKRAESLVAKVKQANVEYEQVKKDITKARQELEQIRNEYVAAEKKLEAFNGKAEKEKQRIKKQVEDCYQQANVTKEEVLTAGKVKAEVESHGFTLELAPDLSKEFAGHKNAKEKLANGLKEHGLLNKYLDDLDEWGEQGEGKDHGGDSRP